MSDLHLGVRGSRADALLSFLRSHDAETIYLVGDVFDLGRFHPPCWSEDHDALLRHILRRRDHGVSIRRLPGNHDARQPQTGETKAHRWAAELPIGPAFQIHDAADGRRHLVAHGDFCDAALLRSQTAAQLGSGLDWLLRGYPTAAAKSIGKMIPRGDLVRRRVRNIRSRLVDAARISGLDGVICGHLHVPGLAAEEGVIYANCGDWLANCTAIAEDWDGAFLLIDGRSGGSQRLPPWAAERSQQEGRFAPEEALA